MCVCVCSYILLASYLHVMALLSQNPGITVAAGGCQFGFDPSTCA